MRPSIGRRFLILSVVTTLLVVGAACCFIWMMMRHSLRGALDDTLLAEARAIAGSLEAERGRIEFEGATEERMSGNAHGDALIMISADDGAPVFASRALDRSTLADQVRSHRSASEPAWLDFSLPPSDDPYRAVALRSAVRDADDELADAHDRPPPVHAWVYVARPLGPVNATLYLLGGVLAAAVGTTGLLALGISLIVARIGAAPIRAAAEELSAVKPDRPELMLDPRRIPIELEPVFGKMQSLLERIRDEMERQRQLTADVAHDLRTPLAGVRALLDVCMQHPRDAREYAETIEKALVALRQLSELVDDLLILARLDASADQPRWEPVSLKRAVDAAFGAVRPLADSRGISLRSVLSGSDAVQSDPAKLSKILRNLLANAVEHSPAGESVILSIRDVPDGFELSVEDRGLGVAPGLRDRVFNRFIRGDAARAGDGHHGLGLPIARGMARLLGGDVCLDPSYADGARFVARLPCSSGAGPDEREPQDEAYSAS